MELRRYRFNRKTGKVYLEVGKELSDIGATLKMIILWASQPVYGKPFAHLPAQNWVQITFLDMQSNWCYALLNSGATDALNPWLEYRNQIESQGLELCSVITTISLISFECEHECFDYSFSGVRRKQILPEIVNQAIFVSNSPMIELKALVEYETRSLASNARFHWDGDRKVWTKKLRECRFNEFVKTLAFGVEII
ncbi:MAG: hypothetical protein HEQ30_23930 [Dolichospermum sp. OL01]|nr:hypothetical protein [Dolichospermum sp. OL01]